MPSRLLPDLEDSKWAVNPIAKCNLCERTGAITFIHSLHPDFDLEKHEKISWIGKFKKAEDGICMTCGHFQRFTKLTEQELDEYNIIFSDKSKTNEGIVSSSSRYKGEKYRANIIEYMRKKYYTDKPPLHIYIARPTSISLIGKIQGSFECKRIDYAENNELTKKEINQRYASEKTISARNDTSVHGRTQLPEGYELYIVIHCFQHSIELKRDLDILEARVRKGGSVLLLDEIQRKIHNPFHVNHLSEIFLLKQLKSRGLKAELIQDMTSKADSTIRGLQSQEYSAGIFVHA